MAAAASDLLTGWCLFGLALLVILIFCWVYVRKYQSRRESEVISTITAIFALAVALITSALLPVDIFLVSYMKNQNGTFKVWADANVSRQIEDTVLYGYYSLYSIILFCVFLWIPFVYFYYEEKEEDDGNTCSQVKTALKYTLGFITVCAVLLLIGAFVPLDIPNKKNSTEWEKVKLLFEEFGSSHGLTALSFSISSLTVIGMLAAITYTAYGMSALPLNLIKGTTSASYERLENTEDIEEVEQHLLRIKSKCRDGRPLSSRDRRTLQQLEERLRTLRRRERHLESIEKSWWTKFCEAIRPLKSNKTIDGQSRNVTLVSKDCDADAPEDQCIVTRTYLFLHKFWFFSAAYYFGNWAFIAVFLIGLVVSCCKGKKSVIEGEVDDDDSDMSDDELSVYYH
ncbi:lysosomal cobalamin transport escort protein LMBD1 isoform 2-T2 [Cyanocitta cristata]